MNIIGKLHEISFYGLISAIVCFFSKKVSIQTFVDKAIHVTGFVDGFISFMFWSTVLFIPISIIGALSTKFIDKGEGLTFYSRNTLVIAFSHIAEELIGLVFSPFWLLKDIFTHNWNVEKVIDYITYFIEIIIIAFGLLKIFGII